MNACWWAILLLGCIALFQVDAAKSAKSNVITHITDHKEFRKLLKSKNNILVCFVHSAKGAAKIVQIISKVADALKGQATIVQFGCYSSTGAKICRTLKSNVDLPYHLRHYKDGSFHKDYDRSETISSMTNFLKEPTGPLPWDEDPEAKDIIHLQSGDSMIQFLTRGKASNKRSIIMFYAPWCRYCSSMKPEYSAAATELKGRAVLAAIDVSKPNNTPVRSAYNITGFPTLLFFDKGKLKYPFSGENTREGIVSFMNNPTEHVIRKEKAKEEDQDWDTAETEVVHLTEQNFDTTLKNVDNALLVFYAPWCGHCKRIKPEWEKAAAKMKEENVSIVKDATLFRDTIIPGILGAVDATKEPELAAKFGVKGYPTLKYFNKGTYGYDVSHARDVQKIIEFMKDPKEPPPPKVEVTWSEEESPLVHLTDANFRTITRKKKHALVVFYAPWCGHCKNAKPELIRAAKRYIEEPQIIFGAVDCTLEKSLCSAHNVNGYPTIKYFSYMDKVKLDYNGGRKEKDFVQYLNGHLVAQAKKFVADQGGKVPAGYNSDIQILSDDSFDSFIGSDTPTFVMFHATWCSICHTLKPSFNKVSEILKQKGVNVRLAAVECVENPDVCEKAKLLSVPVFRLYKAGKMLKDYDGDRSYADMTTFAASAAPGKKDEL